MPAAAPEPDDEAGLSLSEIEADEGTITPAGAAQGGPHDGDIVANYRYDLLRRARGMYERIIDERWVKTSIHGFLVCPVCGALVADRAGQALHREDHRGQAPSLTPILRELEDLARLVREIMEDR